MATPTALASATSSPVTAGAFQDALGTVLANGKLTFDLSQTASVTGGGEIVSRRVTINLDVNGKVAANQSMFRTTDISPSGLLYRMQAWDSNNNLAGDFGFQSISGAAPIDLALLVPSSVGGGVVSFSNAVLLSPSASQTIKSFPLLVDTGVEVGDGTVGLPTFTFENETSTGLYRAGAQDLRVSVNGTDSFRVDSTSPTVPSGRSLAWGSAGVTSRDFGISRIAAGVGAIGNGTQGDVTGTLKLTALNNGGTLSLPTSTDILVARATTDTLTNKIYGGVTLHNQVFNSSGTFTIPANVKSVEVIIVGAGGAGGGSTATNNGGGGGSGAYAEKILTGLTPANTITVTVGTGGTGVSAAAGNNGTSSSISSGTQTITTVTSPGGFGGNSTGVVSAGGGAASIATNGDFVSGGSGGGTAYAGNIGESGAPGPYGGGGQAAGGGAGNNANGPGAGGGGAGAAGNAAGGTGGNGIVVFKWIT